MKHSPAETVAFLGYDRSKTGLIDALEYAGTTVICIDGKVEELSSFDFVVSFGYRHILSPLVLATARRPVVNLHISYLPYNRGAHPNFWSWMENTPAGVTLHEIDAGIDTGPIIAQERLSVDPSGLTFQDTYQMLLALIEKLFLKNIEPLLRWDYQATPQPQKGTYHAARDLPDWMDDWSMPISDATRRFNAER